MPKKFLFLIRASVTGLVLILALICYNRITMPKYRYGQGFPTTDTYAGFYEAGRNTMEVLFFGSSHGVCAFSPEELYNKYEIQSYNLSCEQQNLFTTYYWLKEALKYQSPETVVAECYMLYLFDNEALKPTVATSTRKAFDSMHFGGAKYDAVKHAGDIDSSLTPVSFYMPNVMYHTRWKELSKEDFDFGVSKEGFEYGYYPLYESGVEGFKAIDGAGVYTPAKPDALMLDYLDKIVALCKDKGIRLILVSTPSTLETENEFSYMRNYAEASGIEFVDFNEKSVYEMSDYDFATDNNDDDHANIYGALKITDYMGRLMVESDEK